MSHFGRKADDAARLSVPMDGYAFPDLLLLFLFFLLFFFFLLLFFFYITSLDTIDANFDAPQDEPASVQMQ